jgi:hypothetical protein
VVQYASTARRAASSQEETVSSLRCDAVLNMDSILR